MDETKISGRLANVDVEIVSRKAEDGSGETVTIRMTAQPGFDAAARALLPGLAPLSAGALFANPMQMWMQMAQAAWQPWLQLAKFPLLGPGETK